MRPFWSRRRLVVLGTGIAGLAILVVLGGLVLYPTIGAWALRHRVLPRVAARAGRTIEAGSITASRGHAVLQNVVVAGPADDKSAPLARIARIDVEFDFWASLIGDIHLYTVDVEGAHVSCVRHEDGSDNFRDLARELGLARGDSDARASGGNALGKLRPDVLTATDASLSFRDQVSGLAVAIEDIDSVVKQGQPLEVSANDVSLTTSFGPRARAESLALSADLDNLASTAVVKVSGAEVAARRGISLSSISGRIESSAHPGKLELELRGSYGGATEPLWTAIGSIDALAGNGSIHVEADRFTFDRLHSILDGSALIDYQNTAVDAEMDIEARNGKLSFLGTFELTGANIFHPMLAEKPVTDLDVRGSTSGSFDIASRSLVIDEAELHLRNVDYRLDGFVRMPGGVDPQSGQRRAHTQLSAHLQIPPIPCQRMLEGIPPALASYLQDYRLQGRFETDVRVAIDWADLQATTLDGHVGIFGCRVVKEPEDDSGITRLETSFTHYVEVEVDRWIEFVIGEDNPDFVPIADVSPYLLGSLMTTEDSSFYKHRGFITREFRTALIKNLEAGYFRYGASSITMQTVKNVLLYREKTLARKLQELFLTWHIENRLEKDRIFEIYVNAIEYGPGIYGVGPAARHYFGKHPRDLGPVEAAFFSSILPSPKNRYKQYCDNELWRWTRDKVDRILATMRKRDRLTEQEYQTALATPLVFDRTEALPARECKRMVKQAIAKTRPTNPMKK